jgi:divalent metal cation (Fe/Co/Zn/Cd) transporter
MNREELKGILLRMMTDLLLCTVKLLGAFYGRSLLLAADALFGLHAWVRSLSRPGAEGRAAPAGVLIPSGLILAAAGTGLAWRSVGELIARYQGHGAGPGGLALLGAAFSLAVSHTVRRKLGTGGTELFYEVSVSHWTLVLLFVAYLFPSVGGLLGSLGALTLGFTVAGFSVSILYSAVGRFFTPADTENTRES